MSSSLRCRPPAVVALLFAGTILACPTTARSAETLTVTGNGTSVGTMHLMAASFQAKRPDVTIRVLPSIGSTGAIRAIQADKIDIGLTSRPLTRKERGANIIEESYGRTAFIFAVQDSNPATGFTLAEIEGIYAGKRAAWPDGTPLRLILRPASNSASAYLNNISPGLKSALEKARGVPGVFVGITDQEAAEQIEKTPGAFGTSSASLVASEKRKIKVLSVDGVPPTLDNVATGKYPYATTSVLIYKKDKYRGAVKDFVEFIFSADGQKILHDTEHVTLKRALGE